VRRIEWEGNEVQIHDRLEGSGRHRVESRLVWATQPAGVELEVLGPGELQAEEGWVSERFGERESTAVSCLFTECELPASLGFLLRCLD
jgi:hypothetical protein